LPLGAVPQNGIGASGFIIEHDELSGAVRTREVQMAMGGAMENARRNRGMNPGSSSRVSSDFVCRGVSGLLATRSGVPCCAAQAPTRYSVSRSGRD